LRYRYLGAVGTDSRYVNAACDPIRNPKTGRCVVGKGNALVRFETGEVVVVARRRLRLAESVTSSLTQEEKT
jgi:hypothetical protein